MHKDIRLALEAARQSGVPRPAALAAGSALSQAEQLGYGHRDIAGLFQVLAQAPGAAAEADDSARSTAGAGPKAA